ncbi:MAG: hypothetical protein H8E62_00145 [Planctomycetes bacterium]|nr:hypothetical protein [Planctomycetota bacterium]
MKQSKLDWVVRPQRAFDDLQRTTPAESYPGDMPLSLSFICLSNFPKQLN